LKMPLLDALSIYMNLHSHEFGPPPCQRSSVGGWLRWGPWTRRRPAPLVAT